MGEIMPQRSLPGKRKELDRTFYSTSILMTTERNIFHAYIRDEALNKQFSEDQKWIAGPF